MELKEYISETIQQISAGITDAMENCKGLDVIVNPDVTFGSNGDYFISPGASSSVKRRVQIIEMDIAVSVTEKETNVIGSKVSIPILNVKGDSTGESNISNVNRVKFSIPVCLPTTIVDDVVPT